MKSYFFIPANKPEFLAKAEQIEADHIILDLEDAIFNSSIDEAVNNIFLHNLSRDYFIRVVYPVGNADYLHRLSNAGYRRFFLPKVKTPEDVERFISAFHLERQESTVLEIIVLIESAIALFRIVDFLLLPVVNGITLGSHDYCGAIGMEHSLENLYWARMQLLNTAKAFDKEVIDIASMNLSNEDEFVTECKDGLSKGFDGKFIIHPWQLKLFNEIAHYSESDIAFAKTVKAHIDKLGGISNFSLAKFDGKVVEKPHLDRINQILKSIGHDTI